MTEHHVHTVERHCDVAVVGGSAAGLAAALQLGRQRRTSTATWVTRVWLRRSWSPSDVRRCVGTGVRCSTAGSSP
jgi:glycine/D-amino acid oxidase-like deaminating enzyme